MTATLKLKLTDIRVKYIDVLKKLYEEKLWIKIYVSVLLFTNRKVIYLMMVI
jgi:hypothetical protein